MNTNQQHLLDAYRFAQRRETAPPVPGRHDWEAVREMRDHRRAARKGPWPLRRALTRVFGTRGRSAARGVPAARPRACS